MNRMNPYWPAALLLAASVVSIWASPAQAGDPRADLLSSSDANGDGAIQQSKGKGKPMLETATRPILGPTEFPWVKDPISPQTQEEHAYTSGMLIARTRALLNDDSQNMIHNWGAGPLRSGPAPDLGKLREEGVGPFGIFVAIEPEDLDLYRALLPENFSMPEQPVLSMVIVDYNQPNPIVRYKEGMVMLKGVGKDGEEAWYVHSMPVETWLMIVMGHDWGFRKELFDMTVQREKTTVMQKNGDLYMSLELTSDPWPADAKELVPQAHAGGLNNMAVVYPSRPEMVLRFGWFGEAVALEQEKRMVRIDVNPEIEWAGLVPQGTTAPGCFQRFTITGGTGSFIKKVR